MGEPVSPQVVFWVGGVKLGTYRFVKNPNAPTTYQVSVVKEEVYVGGRVADYRSRIGSNPYASNRLTPYGEELPNEYGTTPNDRVKFATYLRDSDGSDYAGQRYYEVGWGRFTTPDPYLASGGVANPSSWNRFAYLEGDPVNWIDPEGLMQRAPYTRYASITVTAYLTPVDYIFATSTQALAVVAGVPD